MPDQPIENIIKRLAKSSSWLSKEQALHIARITKAVQGLEDNIINATMGLRINKAGRVQGIRTNLENLKSVHRDITTMFLTDFDAETRKMITTFKRAKLDISRNFEVFGEEVKWTGVDEDAMAILKAADKAQYAAIGKASQERVTQALYNGVIGGGSISDLIKEIRNATTGIATMTGRPLSSYAKLYANDMIMNFHNQVTMLKGEELGMKRFLYYGSLMSRSRDFCIHRVGKVYTKKEIESWTFNWKGKRGGAYTFRGGWNCRHHWQPVRKKWLDKQDPKKLQNMFNRLGLEASTPFAPGITKVKTIKIVKPIKPTAPDVPRVPTAKSVKGFLTAYEKSEEAIVLTAKYQAARKAYKDSDEIFLKLRQKALKAMKARQLIKVVPRNDGYNSLMKSMRAAGSNVVADRSISIKLKRTLNKSRADAINKHIRPTKTATPDLTPDSLRLSADAKKRATQIKKIEALAQTAGSMFHADVTKKVPNLIVKYWRGKRAYHNQNRSVIGIGSLTDKKTMAHEFAHAVEGAYPEAKRAALAFRKKRIGNEKLSAIYKGTNEMGWKDEFFDHYCGKYYASGSTEIISMGVERMYLDPAGFLKKDPEYFDLILKIMWGDL